jgi:hypothetical protein
MKALYVTQNINVIEVVSLGYAEFLKDRHILFSN